MRSRYTAAVALVAAATLASCRATPAAVAPPSPDTWATVDNKPITKADVEKAFRRTRDASQTLSDEEAMTAKLSILNDLILQEILLAKAATMKLEVATSDLDAAYNEARKNIPDDAFQEELRKRSLSAGDMRDGLRRELLAQKVVDQEVSSKIAVTDQDVTDYFNANRSQFNVAEEAYHIAQIVVTPVREAQQANATGDDATTPQAAAAKTKMLMDQLKAGVSFRELAMKYSEDPESAQRGGDLGFVPVSRLKQAPPQLRDAVLNKTPGNVNVVQAGGAYTLVLVVGHEQAGQRDLSMPGVKDGISGQIRQRREQLLRAAYLTAVRNDAAVVNYLARRLVEGKGQMPALPLTAPGKK